MLRDAFAANLALAAEKFRGGRSGSDGGRTGVTLALAALIRYARDTRPDVEADLESVIQLAAKLADVEVGKVDRMFKPPKPAKRKGRAPPSLQRESLQQLLTVAVAILMDGGWGEPDAENYVSSKLLEEYGQDIAGPTIGKWRSHVDAHRPRGVGTPGRPDESGVAIAYPDQVGLYLEHWRSWRTFGGQHCIATKQPIMSAKEWVDAHVLNDKLRAFFD